MPTRPSHALVLPGCVSRAEEGGTPRDPQLSQPLFGNAVGGRNAVFDR